MWGGFLLRREKDGSADILSIYLSENYVTIDNCHIQYIHEITSVVALLLEYATNADPHGYTCANKCIFHSCTSPKPGQALDLHSSSSCFTKIVL